MLPMAIKQAGSPDPRAGAALAHSNSCSSQTVTWSACTLGTALLLSHISSELITAAAKLCKQ